MATYVTEGGVLVESVGRVVKIHGKLKVHCRRLFTGGWHGWLKIDRLREATTKEVAAARRARGR